VKRIHEKNFWPPKAGKILGSTLVFFLLSQFVIATSPTPTYHRYAFHGQLLSDSGSSIGGLTIRALGYFIHSNADSFISLDQERYFSDQDSYPAVTDSAGWFYLSVAIGRALDSLVLEVELPGGSIVRGQPFAPSTEPITIYGSTTVEPSCSGCSTNDGGGPTSSYIAGFIYVIKNQDVSI